MAFILFFITECSVSIYGSSFTGFGLQESDVNLDLVIPDEVLCSKFMYCGIKVFKTNLAFRDNFNRLVTCTSVVYIH